MKSAGEEQNATQKEARIRLPMITITDVDSTITSVATWSEMDNEGNRKQYRAASPREIVLLAEMHKGPERLPMNRILVDLAVLVIGGLCSIFLFRLLDPYRRGFFCDDESIRYAYKTNTVSTSVLYFYALLVPALLVLVLATEYYLLRCPSNSEESICGYEQGRRITHRLGIRFATFYGYALLALLSTNIFTSIAKYTVGRLRPHFLEICRPNVNLTYCAPYSHEYITDYECQSHRVAQIREARLSFFSGHSSLSMCASTFLTIYLHCRLHGQLGSRVLVPLAQTAVLCCGMFISYSRIYDHMHHWQDVLAGMLLGSGVAASTALFIAGLDPRKRLNCECLHGRMKYLGANDKGHSPIQDIGELKVAYDAKNNCARFTANNMAGEMTE